jgi:hypothetical protein
MSAGRYSLASEQQRGSLMIHQLILCGDGNVAPATSVPHALLPVASLTCRFDSEEA